MRSGVYKVQRWFVELDPHFFLHLLSIYGMDGPTQLNVSFRY